MKERDARKAKRDAEKGLPPSPTSPEGVGDLLSQQAEPSFVSAAYFLEFKFEPGRYALAGRETLDGREVLRIEYHPARLFGDDKDETVEVGSREPRQPHGARGGATQQRPAGPRARDEQRIEQQMNKTALITLWVLRDEKQIVRYVFDNVTGVSCRGAACSASTISRRRCVCTRPSPASGCRSRSRPGSAWRRRSAAPARATM
jgi:hypothetical protein